MNQLSNLNAKIFKTVFVDVSTALTPTSINLVFENCHTNAFVEQIIINLSSSDTNFGSLLTATLKDRGHSYNPTINSFNPTTFASISTSSSVKFPASTTYVGESITQSSGTVVSIDVNTSVQDSEGVGNIYLTLAKTSAFAQNFYVTVIYRPEATYSPYLNSRGQNSDSNPRVISQAGVGTYGLAASIMTDQIKSVATRVNPRNNNEVSSYGFTLNSANPIFYFGTPEKTKRWYIGFSSDCTTTITQARFSYFNGTAFTSLSTTQVFSSLVGPGTAPLSHDGVIIFEPPTDWAPLIMANDPITSYNAVLVGLGTLATNNLVYNPGIYWIQCNVGFSVTTSSLKVSTVVPLIDPALPLGYKRKLI